MGPLVAFIAILSNQLHQHIAPHQGDVDSHGDLTLYLIRRGAYPVPVVQDDPYGSMLVNDGGGTAIYILGDRKRHSVRNTKSRETFRSWLRALPKGTEIRVYDSCTDSLSRGLPDSARTGFNKLMRSNGIKRVRPDSITCYCDSTG